MRKDVVLYEKKASNYNIIPIFIMAFSGIVFGALSHSSAIVLDGIFSFVLFLTIFLGKWIQKQVDKPKNYDYPMGMSRLSSLYVLFKVLILLGILLFSLINSLIEIYSYFVGTLEHVEIIQSYVGIYYIVKLSAFIISVIIYRYYMNKCNFQSNILSVDYKGTLVDGFITIGIMFGFFVFGSIEILAPISDALILFILSCFLIFEMGHQLKAEVDNILGKRNYISREDYYYGYFNNYFVSYHFYDIYITKTGPQYFCNMYLTFEGMHNVEEMYEIEKELKEILEKEFEEVILNLYFVKKNKFKSSKYK